MRVREENSKESEQALATICQAYWYPLYAYARRAGNSPEDAEDITQGFIAAFLARDGLKKTDPQKGKLRSFLLVSLKRHMRDEWLRKKREKRGGGESPLSIDIEESEAKYASYLIDEMTPDMAYDRLWVIALLEEVMKELGVVCARDGKLTLLGEVAPYLSLEAENQCPYPELAEKLGLSESGVRVAVHRLRKKYRELLRARVADTLDESEDFELELEYLIGLFRNSSSA